MSEIKEPAVVTPFSKANFLYRQGDFKGAVDEYLRAVDRNPDFLYAYLNLSAALHEYGKYVKKEELSKKLESISNFGKPIVSSKDYKLVKGSKLVNGKWYLEEYKLPLNVDPVLHYLTLGWRFGYNPCKRFDTSFYLNSHSGELEKGQNPLLHYIKIGCKKNNKTRGDSTVSGLVQHLWGGHSKNALLKLEKVYRDESQPKGARWSALWHSARWYFFCADFDAAIKNTQSMKALSPGIVSNKSSTYIEVFSYLAIGSKQKARRVIEEYLRQRPDDADAFFAYANCLEDSEEKVCEVNRAYAQHGFVGIKLLNADCGLRFENITGQECKEIIDAKKVSIIMPVYEAEEKIKIAVRSLLLQSYQNIEIIAVDDCSSDRTFAMLKKLAQQDSRIKVVQPPRNGGAYAARNYGLRFVTGELITTHDSDDWSHPQKIETQVHYLTDHPEVKGCSVHWIRAQEDLRFTQNWRPNNVLTHWSQSSFMFRREVLDAIGEWDHVRIGGDTEYIWRMQAHFGKESLAKICPEVPLAFALDEESSLTRTKATHVRTVYFGLRHIYREICAWWHNTSHELYVQDAKQQRTFPAPRSMFERGDEPLRFNTVIAGDFSRLEDCQKAAAYIGKHSKQKVALFHWPSFHKAPKMLCNLYFEQLQQGKVEPVVMGQVVKAMDYYITDVSLLEFPLDGYPGWVGFEEWNNLS